MTNFTAAIENANFVNNFNAEKALRGTKVITRAGHPARVLSKCNGDTKLFVVVDKHPSLKALGTYTIKVNLDGRRYAANVDSIDDLMMAI